MSSENTGNSGNSEPIKNCENCAECHNPDCNQIQEEDEKMVQEIVDFFLREKQKDMHSTSEINAMISSKFSFNFGVARLVDEALVGKSGGYWRSSYNYPSMFDWVFVPWDEDEDGEITYKKRMIDFAGLLTFSVKE